MNILIYNRIKHHLYHVSPEQNEIVLVGYDNPLNFNAVAEDIYELWKLTPPNGDINDLKTIIINNQWDKSILSFDEICTTGSELIGYKYARSSPEPHLGNTTPYIKHVAKAYVEDTDEENDGRGLYFFTNTNHLIDNMTYGDILVKIKINKSIFENMYTKPGAKMADEYCCYRYFVDEILDIRDKSTLQEIIRLSGGKYMMDPINIYQHLQRIGSPEESLDYFRTTLNIKL